VQNKDVLVDELRAALALLDAFCAAVGVSLDAIERRVDGQRVDGSRESTRERGACARGLLLSLRPLRPATDGEP
jgi:hypothetical protein